MTPRRLFKKYGKILPNQARISSPGLSLHLYEHEATTSPASAVVLYPVSVRISGFTDNPRRSEVGTELQTMVFQLSAILPRRSGSLTRLLGCIYSLTNKRAPSRNNSFFGVILLPQVTHKWSHRLFESTAHSVGVATNDSRYPWEVRGYFITSLKFDWHITITGSMYRRDEMEGSCQVST